MPKTLESGRKSDCVCNEVLNIKGSNKVICKYCNDEMNNEVEQNKF